MSLKRIIRDLMLYQQATYQQATYQQATYQQATYQQATYQQAHISKPISASPYQQGFPLLICID
jgi:hypothetical protein